MAIGRSPSRDPRRRPSPSAVASSSRRSVRRVLSPVAKFCKRALRRGASSSGSSTRALTIEGTDDATAGPAAEDEEEGEVNINDVNDILDDGDIPVDATDESSNERKDTQEPTKYNIGEASAETADETATIQDAPPTSSVAVWSANARHASPAHTPYGTQFELTLPGITAGSGEGSMIVTKESFIRADGDQNITEVTDNTHTDVPTSYPVTNGATIPSAVGSSTHPRSTFSQTGDQPQRDTGKGKKRAVDDLAEEGGSDDEREGSVTKRARMSEEDVTEEKRREEKREGKKRARSDDDGEVSPSSSGEAETTTDDQHRAKRTKHSLEGPSLSDSSTPPRRPGLTSTNDANDFLPTPEESQENEIGDIVPAAIPAPPMAQVIATLTFHGLVTPDASDASDDDSDSSYSYSGSSSSYDSDDIDSSSGYDSDDTLVAPAPAAAPVFIIPPPPPPQLVPPPTQLRRARAFYGTAMLRKVLRAPYI